jgi:hypothetical protein
MMELIRANASDRFQSLESQHCRAISREIGERLRQDLEHEQLSLMPRHLSRLLGRLSELDRADAFRTAS